MDHMPVNLLIPEIKRQILIKPYVSGPNVRTYSSKCNFSFAYEFKQLLLKGTLNLKKGFSKIKLPETSNLVGWWYLIELHIPL